VLQSTSPVLRFETGSGLPLEAAFDAGRLTSDGGLPWVSEADRALGLCEALAGCIPEWRQRVVRHDLVTLVRQRVYQIVCGYEDQNDATTLRTDPLLKLVCGRRPESGDALASQPTLSRLENAVDRHAVEALARTLVEVYVRERGLGSRRNTESVKSIKAVIAPHNENTTGAQTRAQNFRKRFTDPVSSCCPWAGSAVVSQSSTMRVGMPPRWRSRT